MKYSEFMNLASCLTAADMQARFANRTKNQAWFDVLTAIVASREEGSLLQVNIERNNDTDEIVAIFVGLPILGIVAQFNAHSDEWFECSSRGDFGKNLASGGHWAIIRHAGTAAMPCMPDIVWNVIEQQAAVKF